jgi:hypothetical protein
VELVQLAQLVQLVQLVQLRRLVLRKPGANTWSVIVETRRHVVMQPP